MKKNYWYPKVDRYTSQYCGLYQGTKRVVKRTYDDGAEEYFIQEWKIPLNREYSEWKNWSNGFTTKEEAKSQLAKLTYRDEEV